MLPIIIPTVALICAAIVTVLALKGTVLGLECPTEIEYGQPIECHAKVFWSDVLYEYSADGGNTWGREAPLRAGTYLVRASGKTLFGGYRAGAPVSIVIRPKRIGVVVGDTSVVYGNVPTVTTDIELMYQDRVFCEDFAFSNGYSNTTADQNIAMFYDVLPELEAVRILDKQGEDVTASYVIEPIASEIAILKRPITVTVENASQHYNALPFSFHGYELSGGTLFESDRIIATFTAELTDPGSIPNEPTLKVVTQDGADRTVYYDITSVFGTLTVEKRPLVIIPEGGEFEYNGKEFECADYAIDETTSLVQGHQLILTSNIKPVNAGKYLNAQIFEILDENGAKKTENYAIFVEQAYIVIKPKPLAIHTQSGEWMYDDKEHTLYEFPMQELIGNHTCDYQHTAIRHVGTKENRLTVSAIFDENGNDVTANYAISYQFGTLRITPRPLTVTTFDGEWVYDGQDHVIENYVVEGLLENHVCNSSPITIKNVGMLENSVVIHAITNEQGEDVKKNYAIEFSLGTLRVTPRPLAITTFDGEWVYDGQDHMLDNYTVAGLVKNHDCDISVERIRNVESKENSVVINAIYDENGENVLDNYDVEYEFGMLTVTPRPLKVFTGNGYWIYDGQYHESDQYTFDGLVEWHTAVRENPTQIKNAGLLKNEFSVLIYSDREPVEEQGSGQSSVDVTGNYEITYVYGWLEVAKRPVTIRAMGDVWVYDAMEHFKLECAIDSELGIAEGEEIVVLDWPGLVDVGIVKNKLTCVIRQSVCTHGNSDERSLTESELDCCETTFNYDITWKYDNLIVLPRQINFKPVDEEKVYDDLPLTATKLMITDDSPYPLVPGHVLQALSIDGSITDVGTTQSTVKSYQVLDENGRNVTKNYLPVSIYPGTLTVLPRTITVYTASAQKYFDGSPLTKHEYGTYPDQLYDLVANHRLSVVSFTGTQTEIGESENSLDISKTRIRSLTRDVTHNYVIQYEFGTLKVLPYAVICVTSATDWKYYDGEPLTNPNYELLVSDGTLRTDLGHQLQVEVYGSITEIGTVPNRMSVRIVDAKMRDVSKYYELIEVEGELEIREPIEQNPEGPEETVIGQIKTDTGGTIYLRERSYGSYNGRSWGVATPYWKTLPDGSSYNYLTSIALSNSGRKASVAELKDLQIFMLPYYMGYGDGYEIQNLDTFYVGLLECFTVPYYTLPDNLESLKGNLGDLSELEEEYREYVYQMYLTLDEETRAYMQGLIAEQDFDANDPRIIKTVARYVQNAAEYDLEYDVAMDSEPNVAIAFLSTYKKGICVHYASAATLLFRALGIPARYVEGFMVETKAGTFVDIKTPGHAWVEVYVDGIGWIQVEVTGSTNDGPSSDQGSGDIPLEKLPLEIMPGYQWKIYDGEPLVAIPEIEMNLILADLLSQGYTYVANVTGEQTEVGLGISTITDFTLYDANMQDVTDRYDLIYKEGVLEVLEPEKEVIRVYLHQIQKYYDGTALSFEEEDYSIIEIPDGVTLELDLHISLTDVGTITLSEINGDIDTYATYRVYRDGADVTDQFVLIFDVFIQSDTYLPIRVDKRVITVTSGSQTKIYDGEPLTNNEADVSFGKLVDGHYLEAQVTGSIIDVGEQENFIETIVIRDASGADVTDFYEITLVHGKLTILSPDT